MQEFDNLSMRVYRYLDKKEQAGDLDILLTHMGMEIKVKPQQNKLDDKLFPGICAQVYNSNNMAKEKVKPEN